MEGFPLLTVGMSGGLPWKWRLLCRCCRRQGIGWPVEHVVADDSRVYCLEIYCASNDFV